MRQMPTEDKLFKVIWLSSNQKPYFPNGIESSLICFGSIFFLQKVDTIWKSVMMSVEDSANAVKTASQAGLLEKLNSCTIILDKIVKGLNAYLEKKRLFFPR